MALQGSPGNVWKHLLQGFDAQTVRILAHCLDNCGPEIFGRHGCSNRATIAPHFGVISAR